MPPLFGPRANTIARLSIVVAFLAVAGGALVAGVLARSPYATRAQESINQPVMFSHQHHTGDLGIDCRYCHTSVEDSSFAGLPATEICMTCHSQIWTDSPLLAPVRQSFATNTPLQWNRVNDLPDFVYFDHSIHVRKGIGCATCHGQVDEQPLALKQQPFNMSWCLDCHRAPQQYLRPLDQITNMHWQPSGDQATLGQQLFRQYHILGPDILTSCSTCHR
jgi:Cytochrome c7 and related cytochrome c/Class III cytochrome C family